ncbi:STAS domain-containing protein [Streptomyces avermitilis]|uniref:STAS domain-containing protein n=1 Tax=Streptomyces avermitilis TaxID=33903 RepID=UPI0033CAC1F0
MPERLTIAHTTTPAGIGIVSLRGEIDHQTAAPVRDALRGACDNTPYTVVDLSDVTFVDSSGINALVHAHQTVSAADGWLRLAGCQDPVLRVLHIVGLDTVIACYPTLQHALHP